MEEDNNTNEVPIQGAEGVEVPQQSGEERVTITPPPADPIAADVIPTPEIPEEKPKDLMDHFVSGTVDFQIDGYDFTYQPPTAGDEYEWAKAALKEDQTIDNAIVTKMKLGNVVKAPYTPEIIEKIIGENKTWENCSIDEKYLLFNKMKGAILDEIVLTLNKIDKGEDVSKNL